MLNLRTAFGTPSAPIGEEEITLAGPSKRNEAWDQAIDEPS